MDNKITPVLAACCLLVGLVDGYAAGPPVSTVQQICTTMLPNHGVTPQTGNGVSIELGNTCYKEGHKIPVTVKLSDNSNIRGIFVQARMNTGSIQTNAPQGTFEASGKISAIQCTSAGDSVGHNQRIESDSVTFNWVAPSSDQGSMRIVMTVVKEQTTFWTFQQSDIINYSSTCVESGSSTSVINYALLAVVLFISAMLR